MRGLILAAAVLLALGQPVLAQDWQQVEAQDLRLARVADGLLAARHGSHRPGGMDRGYSFSQICQA